MQSVYSVSQINAYIKNMFTQDFVLNRVAVGGEVSNCKYHTSGHIYFSLKDKGAAIACVMFAGQRKGLAFSMKDGQRVVVKGSVNVYERDGRYQVYAREIALEGTGDLYQKFAALKKELEEMGMFSADYKQPIPFYIKKLGIVTAPTGAAIRDIMNIAARRNPYVQLILYPALVQGDGAAASIVRGIEMLDQAGVDVIIAGRGGGSIEDLWAFNEEAVARAIFDCQTPVISAVGHETDITIADFVADLRAPTPSAAAELAVYDYRQLQQKFTDYQSMYNRILYNKIALYRSRLKQYETSLHHLSPESQIREKRQRLVDIEDKLGKAMTDKLNMKKHRLQIYLEKFHGLSPLLKLEQGFSYTEDESGRAVTSIAQVEKGQPLWIKVTDGSIKTQVQETAKGSYQTVEDRK